MDKKYITTNLVQRRFDESPYTFFWNPQILKTFDNAFKDNGKFQYLIGPQNVGKSFHSASFYERDI